MTVICYHNPRCGKSRDTLKLLQDKGLAVEVIEYLKQPPSTAELEHILDKLGMGPRQLMRKQEAPYKTNNLADAQLDNATLIRIMVENPILIERPIVLANGKAAIGRPPEAVLAIL